MTQTYMHIASWTASSDEDAQAWRSMSRTEQLAALKEMANRPQTSQPTETTVADILARVRAKRTQSRLYE